MCSQGHFPGTINIAYMMFGNVLFNNFFLRLFLVYLSGVEEERFATGNSSFWKEYLLSRDLLFKSLPNQIFQNWSPAVKGKGRLSWWMFFDCCCINLLTSLFLESQVVQSATFKKYNLYRMLKALISFKWFSLGCRNLEMKMIFLTVVLLCARKKLYSVRVWFLISVKNNCLFVAANVYYIV